MKLMNDKDKDAFEVWFDANCSEFPDKFPHRADRKALYDNWQRAWQAALDYTRKDNP